MALGTKSSSTTDTTTDTTTSDSTSTTSSTDTSSENLKVNIQQDTPKNFSNKFNERKSDAEYPSRTKDAGLINEVEKTSIMLKNGGVSLAATTLCSLKLQYDNTLTTTSYEKTDYNNRQKFVTDEILVNGHKMNPHLWQLTDFKTIDILSNTYYLGDLTFDGAVLSKVWDTMLGKYVLMRVPYRSRLFGRITDVPCINNALNVADSSKVVTNYDTKQTTVSAGEWYKNVSAAVQESQDDGKMVPRTNADGTITETTTKETGDNQTTTTEVIKDKDGNTISSKKTVTTTEDGKTTTVVENYDKDGKRVGEPETKTVAAQNSGTSVAEYEIYYKDGGTTHALINVSYVKNTSNKIHRQIRLTDKCKESGSLIKNRDDDFDANLNCGDDMNTILSTAKMELGSQYPEGLGAKKK
jgi:hypothetical protein